MYIVNDIAYAGEPTAEMRIDHARYLDDRMYMLTFSTGETRLFDVTPLLELPAFSPLANEETLRRFKVSHGVLTWMDGDIDIDPTAAYEQSYAYEKTA